MSEVTDDLLPQVEAILFAAGKPLSAKEVAEALRHGDPRAVASALKSLAASYERRECALEVRRVSDRYALQLRERFVAVARVVTPMEMSPRTVKALTLIAYHQPMLQSFLVRMFGEGAYGEVQRLRGMGLVRAEPKGATLELSTTKVFAEYFGMGSTRPEEIRQYLENKVGVVPASAETPTPTAGTEPTSAPDEPTAGPDATPSGDAPEVDSEPLFVSPTE
ncbi:MAG TPA: SMC-Scp complex subunit ScpB [Thermoplasmata archaeon]|nr:SMC-Scp complex subunit ScpB [Thermoplasmata archaeon]